MNESQLQRVYHSSIYRRDARIITDKSFVNIHDGSQYGTHWTCFILKDNKSFYFDRFGGHPDKFLLNLTPYLNQ